MSKFTVVNERSLWNNENEVGNELHHRLKLCSMNVKNCQLINSVEIKVELMENEIQLAPNDHFSENTKNVK